MKYITGTILASVGRAKLEAMNSPAKVHRAGRLMVGTARYKVLEVVDNGPEAKRIRVQLNEFNDELSLNLPNYVVDNLPETEESGE